MLFKIIQILPLLRYFPNALHSKKILNCAVKLARCATSSSLKKFFAGIEFWMRFRFSDWPIGKVTDCCWKVLVLLLLLLPLSKFWITIKWFCNIFPPRLLIFQSGNLNFQAFTRWLENQIRAWNILTLKLQAISGTFLNFPAKLRIENTRNTKSQV